MMKKYFLSLLMVLCAVASKAAITITEVDGWFEAGYVTWTGDNQNYNVFVRPEGGEYTQLDKELVRKYATYYRADAVGLKAGNYQFKIVGANNETVESDVFTAAPHDRSGFAHVGYPGGIGAYKNDGTLKDGARVIYVTAKTAKTVKCNVNVGTDTEFTGLQAIIAAFEKGKETRPLAIRIIGTIKKADVDAFGSSAEGIQVKGKSGSTDMNITIEGIGNDATTHGFGFLVRSACSVEIRNFANMICMDDCLSLDTDNHHVWIHNMDLFYGGTGGDADQAKGDGSIDIKGKSSHVTISYNHFYDSGKCSLGGMKSETTDCWMTYHHNWFDHSDSRHPRIRTAFYHCYNNYYDGNSKYGVGVTSGGSSFVEANYFRNVKYPMLISLQGTDAEGSGTFSGENGGVNKAYNNIIINPRKIQYYDGSQTDGKWDAVLVDNRADAVTAKAFAGGTSYNAAADQAARTSYVENKMDAPEDVPAIVTGKLGAGRLQHGDFKWAFNNSLQDENYDVISDLKQTLLNYEGTVVSFADGTAISDRTPATQTVDGGDGKGLDPDTNNSYVPSWAGGGSTIASGKQIVGTDGNFFYFIAENAAQLNTYMTDGGEENPSTITTTGTYSKTRTISNSTIGSCSDYVGSVNIPSKGHLTLYNAGGISSAAFYVSASGSQNWQLYTSTDGNTFTKVGSEITGKAGAHPTAAYTNPEGTVKYVRIVNTNSSARDVQGVKLYSPLPASDLTAVKTETIEIQQGGSYTLTKGTDYTTSSEAAITYKSSSPKVATVDETGKISALTQGNTTITLTQATDDTRNGGTLTFKVTVTDERNASDLTLNSAAEITVLRGQTSQIDVTCTNAVTYSSSAPSIATVSESGLVTAVAFGTATITISDPGSTTMRPAQKTVVVTVPDNRAASTLHVAADKEEVEVNRGANITIEPLDAKGTVTYRSTDETIATVTAAGVVTGIMAGTAVIVLTDEGDNDTKAGTANVTVTVNDPRSPSQLTITSDKNVTIDLAVANTSTITYDKAAGAVTFESSDPTIVAVSAEGVMTGKKAGTATITVSDTGNNDVLPGSQTVNVTVKAVPSADPITWVVSDASTLKAGTSISDGGTAIFISTDEQAWELEYHCGSSCEVEVKKGVGTFKMGGGTQYASSGEATARYFVLPALTGSGTLTINYASSNQSDIAIKTSLNKNDAALATVTKTDNEAQLTDLDNTVLYLTASSKAYLSSISWTPSAPDTRSESQFTLTSDEAVEIAIGATSTITYDKAAGSVTFESDNTAVATVSAEGVITGVADGTATITVKDAGSTEVKGATKKVTVKVGTGVSPDPTPDPVDGDAVMIQAGTLPTGYQLNGATTVTKYTNNDWLNAQNMFEIAGSSTNTVTLPANVKVTKIILYFVAKNNSAKNDKTINLAGKTFSNVTLPSRKGSTLGEVTADNLSVTDSFTFSIDYDSAVKLALTVESATAITTVKGDERRAEGDLYDLMGRRVVTPVKGQVYIMNGKKYSMK